MLQRFSTVSRIVLVFALVLSAGVGCNKAQRKAPGPVETPFTPDEQMARKKAASGDSTGAARIYANLGEGILFDHGPVAADPLFDQAIAENSNEPKALFYSAFTKPLIAMGGFLPRMEGRLDGQDPDREQHARHDLQSFPELYAWAYTIANGDQAFSSLHDVQRFFREKMLALVDNSVATLTKLEGNLPTDLLMSFAKYRHRDPNGSHDVFRTQGDRPLHCEQRKTDGTWFCQPGKKGETPRTVALDQYDLRVMTHSVRAISDYIRLNTAYSTEGWEMARIQISESRQALADNAMPAHGPIASDATILSQYPNLFTLESDQLLGDIQKSTFTALQDAEELASLDATLCAGSANRMKANAFYAAICLHDDAFKAVVKGIEVLNGPAEISIGRDPNIPLGPNGDENEVKIAINVPALLANPPKDLKPLIARPATANGGFMAFPDSTFGGLFPGGDYVSAFNRATWRAHWNQVPTHMKSYGIIPYPYQ